MNKKLFKRLLGIALLVLIVGANVVKTPEILTPVMQLIIIVIMWKVVIGLLKTKDKKETDGGGNHKASAISIYSKLPTGAVLVVAVVVGILAIKFVAPTLTPFSVIGGIILGIFLCYRITKNVKKELEEDD